MSEILTESFCERCGTRYTFESATPRGARLKGIKTLSRGLKNFVMSDDTSIDEAMAAARSESDREVTVHQLDAFHETFNFCMSCRQYTCGNCWNEAENQCLSCSPHLGHEILPAPFPNIDANMGLPTAAAGNGANGHGAVSPSGYTDLPTFDTSAWPTADLVTEQPPAPGIEEPPAQVAEPTGETPLPADFLIGDDMPLPADFPIDETAPSAAAEPVEAAAEAVVAEAAAVVPALTPEPAPAPGATLGEEAAEETDLRAAAAAAQTAAMLQRFRPGQSLDEALAEYESEHEPAEAAAEVASVLAEEPVIAEEAPETVEAEAEAAPDVQITTEPAAEPVAAEAEVEAPVAEELVAEPEPEPVVVAEAGTEAEAALDVQIAAEPAAEPVVAEAEVESPVAEELVPAEPEPEPVVAAEAETPVAAEPEPIASQPRRDDKVEQPTWRIVAPEEPPAVAPVVTPPPAPAAPTEAPATPPAAIQAQEPVAPVAPEPAATPAEPQWPTQPQWPAQARTSEGLPFLGRPAAPTGGLEALWAESAREVTAAPAATTRAGVEPCVSCGLSLSATARFCRRCGTRQG
jgi:ribosomal protein L40E